MGKIFSPKFIVILLLIGIVFLLALIRFIPKEISPTPTPTKQPTIINPVQKGIVGVTKKDEIERHPNLIGKEELPDGSTKYSLSTFVPQRTDEVIVKDNVLIYQKVATPVSPDQPGYSRISDYEKQFGQPDNIIQGSATYGPFTSFYIYNSKGFAFIGNPHTDEVYEIQTFTPMSVEEYTSRYGSDIKQGTPQDEIDHEN